MTVLIALLAFILLYWTVETVRLRRALAAIPVRIHVNGSRGKSSVTRLIAGALREAGIPTVAKTTGSRARLIHTDGTEDAIVRIGSPNICEQVDVLDRARREGAQAIVMECMAIRPDLQRITEDRIMHSTIGVITNVRADHLDVMGPTVEDVGVALAATVPRRGAVVVGDPQHSEGLRRIAGRRRSRFEVAATDDLPADVLGRFGYLEHAQNVATALAVARQLGIPDQISLSGMLQARPDPGACTRWQIEHRGVPIEFHNIFAANDLESTIAIWRRLGLADGGSQLSIALLNLRGDRLDRSLQFAAAVESRLRAAHYVIVGDFSPGVRRRFEHQVPRQRLHIVGRASPEQVFDRLAEIGGPAPRVGGVGNIGGLGHAIVEYAARRNIPRGGTPC